ncbi:MAG: ABC transporter permease [Bacilli bacterium]|jgi:NitT/TauT family transport system permease protein
MSDQKHQAYLSKLKRENYLVISVQVLIIILFISSWEIFTKKDILNTFLFSSPSNVFKTIKALYLENNLFYHILVTCYETLISFFLGTLIGLLIATIMWWNKFIAKVIDPYLTVLNSLPKIALGPILIIWSGANINSIIIMALLVSVIITIINIYNGFINVEENKIKLLKSFKASNSQIFTKLILPANTNIIINVLKINISLSLIGVIMGEFLVSKAGIGYLIMYGSQVFNLNLVITGIILLGLISYLMYFGINQLEKLKKDA